MYGFQSMAYKSYQKFTLKAVTISQDSRMISADQIPFPAITFTGAFEHSYDFLLTEFFVYMLFNWGQSGCDDDCQVPFTNLR